MEWECLLLYSEMAQAILDDQKYEPKKEDFIDKIPETIPEGNHSIWMKMK